MMMKNQINEHEQLKMLTIEQLPLRDYLVRKLDAAIDFSNQNGKTLWLFL